MVGIEGVHVEVFKDGALVKEGYTDADGKYNTTLVAGTYLIRLSKTGYTTVEKTEVIPRDAELMVNLPKTIVPSVSITISVMTSYVKTVMAGRDFTGMVVSSYTATVP